MMNSNCSSIRLQTMLDSLPETKEGHWRKDHKAIVDYIRNNLDPKTMIEIGLNNGFSACMWLACLRLVRFDSIDIGLHKCVDTTVSILRKQYPHIFHFHKYNSTEIWRLPFWKVVDLVFVDGCHQYEYVLNDMKFAMQYGRYILLDDTGGKSPGVVDFLKTFNKAGKLKELKRWDIGAGCRLYENLTLNEPRWELNVVYHIKAFPHLYPFDIDRNHVRFIRCSGYKNDTKRTPEDKTLDTEYSFNVKFEADYPIYNPSYQMKRYHAPSAIYHVFKNGDYGDYVGFCEYDMDFRKADIVNFLQRTMETKQRFVVCLSVKHRLNTLNSQLCNTGGKNFHCVIDQFYKLYEEFVGKPIRPINKFTYIPTQQSFFCDRQTFEHLGKWITFLMETKTDVIEGLGHRPSTVMERMIGLAIQRYDDVEKVYYTIPHLGLSSKNGFEKTPPTPK